MPLIQVPLIFVQELDADEDSDKPGRQSKQQRKEFEFFSLREGWKVKDYLINGIQRFSEETCN